MTTLTHLITRIASAKEGSEELSYEIRLLLFPDGTARNSFMGSTAFTTSVAAAFALIRVVLPGWNIETVEGSGKSFVELWSLQRAVHRSARADDNIPLALCEALLRAVQGGE